MADENCEEFMENQAAQVFSDQEILAFLTAAQNGDVKILQEFLSRGMPVDTLCLMFAETALVKACRMGEVETVKFLCDHDADVNSVNGTEKETALHIAVKNRWPEIARFLLCHSADPNVRDTRKTTPLMLAASMGDPEMMKILTVTGCELDATDWRGMCALHHCFLPYQGRIVTSSAILECVKVLVEAGANMDILSHDAWTALSLAVGRRLTQLTKYFLLQNCDPGRNSPTVLQDSTCILSPHVHAATCTENNTSDCIHKGARNPEKKVPLSLAISAFNVQVVTLLLTAGSSCAGHCAILNALITESPNLKQLHAIKDLICKPRSLKESCRVAIRDWLRECKKISVELNFVQGVESLSVPKSVKDFILLKELEDM